MKLKFYERIDPFCVILVLAVSIVVAAMLYSIKSAEEECPKFEYMQDAEVTSENNKTFYLQKGYSINEGHSYDIVETEEGYDMVFHFIEGAQ